MCFQPILFLLSFQDTNVRKGRSFVVGSHVTEVVCFSSLFSVSWSDGIISIIVPAGSFLCSSILLLSPSTEFLFQLLYFAVVNFSGSSLFFCLFAKASYFFSCVSTLFLIVHWSIFMVTALKYLSDYSNIFVFLVLAFMGFLFLCSFWDLPGYCCDECFSHETWTFLYYVLRFWVLFKPSVLSAFSDITLAWSLYSQVEVEVQGSALDLH